MILTVAMLTTAHADTWTIAGAVYSPNRFDASNTVNTTLTTQLFGTAWAPTETANDMILYGGTGTKYYLIKEITLDATSDATVEFKVCKDHAWTVSHPYGSLNGSDNTTYNSDTNAWVYLQKPSSGTKTYKLLFTFDSNDTESLDVVQMAKVVDNDYNTPTDETSWATYLEMNAMTLDNLTYTFSKEFTNVSANTTKTFTALTIHRSPTYADRNKVHNNVQKAVDEVNEGSTSTVTFTNAGNYQVDFEYNLLSGEFKVISRRYHDVSITEKGNNLGQNVSYGYATFSCDYATEVPSGVNAYYITGTDGGEFTTQSTDLVPATTSQNYQKTGVVLQAEVSNNPSENKHRFFEYIGSGTITLTDNKLCGTGSGTITIPDLAESGSFYVLAKVGDVIAFYKADYENWNTHGYNTYPSYKAFYYTGLRGSSAREYYTLDFMDDTADMEALLPESIEEEHTYYDLQGRRVEHPTKGLYIINGKKVVIK